MKKSSSTSFDPRDVEKARKMKITCTVVCNEDKKERERGLTATERRRSIDDGRVVVDGPLKRVHTFPEFRKASKEKRGPRRRTKGRNENLGEPKRERVFYRKYFHGEL